MKIKNYYVIRSPSGDYSSHKFITIDEAEVVAKRLSDRYASKMKPLISKGYRDKLAATLRDCGDVTIEKYSDLYDFERSLEEKEIIRVLTKKY